jgi:hypothetical protein
MFFIFKTTLLIMCFFSVASASPIRFLTITDIHYGSENNSMDGQDTGTEFLTSTFNQLKKLSKNVDFILNLGDLPTHLLFDQSKKGSYEQTVFHGLYQADEGLKPIFYITGNNDSLAGNYQPFQFEGKSPLNFATDWLGACAFCKGLMIDDSHMQSGGYYSSYVIPGNKEIILIALNTTPLGNRPILLPQYPNQASDAMEELAWLEQQLKSHSAKQLLIAMHAPPGKTYKGGLFWQESTLKKFLDLLEKYHHLYNEIALLTAHTHMDELRKIHLEDGLNIYAYSTPAISRIHYNNPGIKIFSLDNDLAISNYQTYYTSHVNHWGDEQYQALGSTDAIFPSCQKMKLADCLNSLSDQQVCDDLEGGQFYGAKSAFVPRGECKITYPVN